MKICIWCELQKPLEEFSFKSKALNKRHSYCKECKNKYTREHYAQNLEYYLDKAKRNKSLWKEENKWRILDLLRHNPCRECGESDPVLLQFDHCKGTKHEDVSVLVAKGASWSRILQEIDKCQILCVRCHTLKTAAERKWFVYVNRKEEIPQAFVAQLDRAPVFGTGG